MDYFKVFRTLEYPICTSYTKRINILGCYTAMILRNLLSTELHNISSLG